MCKSGFTGFAFLPKIITLLRTGVKLAAIAFNSVKSFHGIGKCLTVNSSKAVQASRLHV